MPANNAARVNRNPVQSTRRTASMQEKLEEARARRAAILSTAPLGNNPQPVAPGPTADPDTPKPEPRPETVRVAFNEPPTAEDAAGSGNGLKWTVRSLSVLLVALVATAGYQLRGTIPDLPMPDVTASVVQSLDSNVGSRSGALSRVSHVDFSPLRISPAALPQTSVEQRPTSDLIVPTAASPRINASLAPQAQAPGQPANITALSGNIRPLGRPDGFGTAQAAN